MGRFSTKLHRFAYGAGRCRGKALLAALLLLPLPAMAEKITLAALGDSLTQGYGLPQEQGFVPQLETWLKARGHDVAIINAGVSGDTTAGGLARVDWTLTPEVQGMIVALGGNDLLRGLDPAMSRSNLSGILQAAEAAGVQVLLVGMQAPGNYGPEYKAAFDSMYPELADAFDTLLAPDFFAGFAAGGDPAGVADLMQGDGLHPNADGVVRIVETLGPEVEALLDQIR